MPLLRTAMYAQRVELYCAPTVDDRDTWPLSMRHIAFEGRCFVLSAVQYFTRDDAPADCPIEATPGEVLIRGGSIICGQVLRVPVVEAPGETRVARFGWKNQQASLLSFSGDAYINEMGITSRLFPDEITKLCNTADEPNNKPGPDGLEDIDKFTRFMRATKAPPRDRVRAETRPARKGSNVFDEIGCAVCHVRSLTTAPAGTKINGNTFTIPDALGSKKFHPFSDFLLHDVGTGDGIVMAMEEHYGRNVYAMQWKDLSVSARDKTQNKLARHRYGVCVIGRE